MLGFKATILHFEMPRVDLSTDFLHYSHVDDPYGFVQLTISSRSYCSSSSSSAFF